MIFDLVALNGGVRYLYKDGTLFSKLCFRNGYTKVPFDVTNTDNLEIFMHRETGDTVNGDIIFGESEEFPNAPIDLTPYSKLIVTISSNEIEFHGIPSLFFVITPEDFPAYQLHGASALLFNKHIQFDISDVEKTYEIDLSDLTGLHYILLALWGESSSGSTLKISSIRLQ